ncbi:MAG: hypothetical protein HY613_02380 [Candidatus Rokubacteria bacterium]|nr:hypothetical protein [Candidatus Rokubacteria bacterium]
MNGGEHGDAAIPQASGIEERGLALVKELARVGRGADPPAVKLEGVLEILFGAFSGGDEPFRRLLLEGWIRGRQEKAFRLAMAWLREQMRLCVEEILAEGITAGAFRADVDPSALAAVCVGAAEGYLLQSRDEEGTVPPGQLVRAILGLVTRNPQR